MLRAVLFDMDGVLIDTHLCAYSVLAQSAQKLGVDISVDEILSMGSLSGKQFWTSIKQRYDLSASVESLIASYDVEREMSFYDDIGLMPNIERTIRALKDRGLKTGLVTSAKPIRVRKVLSLGIFSGLFDVMVTADDVSLHKPDPACYELALTRLSVTGAQTLVVEDSSNGANAARDAGCRVVAYRGTMWKHDPFDADHYITDHSELVGIIESAA